MANDVIIPYVALVGLLEQWIGSGSFGLVAHLYKNDMTPNANTQLADFSEADYTTYTPGNVAPPTASVSNPDEGALASPLTFAFPTPGPTDSITLYGWWMDLSEPGEYLVACQRFDSPIVLPDTSITLAFALNLLAQQRDHPPAVGFVMIIPGTVHGGAPTYLSPFTVSVIPIDLNGYPTDNYTGNVSFSSAGGDMGDVTLGTSPSGPPPPIVLVLEGLGVTDVAAIATLGGPNESDTITVTDGVLTGSQTYTVNKS